MPRLCRLLTITFLALLPVMYLLFLEADPIGGMLGILWSDEGMYLLSAKHAVLFGTPHLFPHDAYQPEYTAPLIHHLGLLVLTKENTVWGIRLTVALLVLSAQFLLARMAWRYHANNPAAGRWAWAILLLCPMLYFYARVGLSEGVQYFLLVLGLCGLWNIRQANTDRSAWLWTMGVAAIIPLLFIGKITSISAVIGLGIGLVVTLVQKFPFRKAMRMSLGGDIGFFVMAVVLYFWWIQGHEAIWWFNNIANPVFAENMPLNAAYAWYRLKGHAVGLHHFLTLMPIFVLGFSALVMAADRTRGFVWTLWLVAITILSIEFLFGGELRRSFFGFSMLMVLAAFMLPEWLAQGIRWRRPWGVSRWFALAIIAAFLAGSANFCYEAIMVKDAVYAFTGPIYVVLLAGALLLSGPRLKPLRTLLLALLMIASFLPMLWQILLGPRTIQTVTAALEKEIGPDEAISSSVIPWSFQGMKRKFYFTQCLPAGLHIGNPPDKIPYQETRYFFAIPQVLKMPECLPPDFDQYEEVAPVRIFYPFNKGPGYGGSRNWMWVRGFTLYKKRD